MGTKLWALYNAWSVDGEAQELEGRTTWPYGWMGLHALLTSPEVGFSTTDAAAIKTETVFSPERPSMTDQQIIWPGLQRLFRDFVRLEDGDCSEWDEHRMDFDSLATSNTLMMKKSSFTKKVREDGRDKTNEALWTMYNTR